jgi:hypothetical protein
MSILQKLESIHEQQPLAITREGSKPEQRYPLLRSMTARNGLLTGNPD